MTGRFQISDEQIEALAAKDTGKLADGLADLFGPPNPAYGHLPKPVRSLMAEAAIAEAKSHGMVSLAGITSFVTVMADMTPRFAEFEPFRSILARQDIGDAERMDLIMSDDMAPHWQAVMDHLGANDEWHGAFWDERVDLSRLDSSSDKAIR